MFSDAYPDSQHFQFDLPRKLGESDSFLEKIRVSKNYKRSLFKRYGCLSEECVWEKINASLKPNDIISGHIKIDEIKTNKYENRLVTLIRNPMDRIISEYNYTRLGYLKRNKFQKLYHRNKLMAAGKYDLEGYLSFMNDHDDEYGRFMKNYILGKDFSGGNELDFMLENYFSFGTVEKIEKFIGDFKNKTGITLTQQNQNITKQKKVNTLSPKEVALIEKICGEDIDLYMKIDNYIENLKV